MSCEITIQIDKFLQGFKSHRAFHEFNGIIGHSFEQLVRERKTALRDVQKGLLLVIAAERTESREKDVSQNPNRPNIGLQRQRLVLNDLRGDEVWGALYFADVFVAFDCPRKAKVTQLESV